MQKLVRIRQSQKYMIWHLWLGLFKWKLEQVDLVKDKENWAELGRYKE